jgi:fructoselysine-6-P-deglycase FrlB-like protein
LRLRDLTEFLRKNYDGILKQERGLAETIENVSNKSRHVFDGIRLVFLLGAGDSYAVADYGKWAFLSVGLDAISVSSTDLQYVKLDENCLVIGVTASGRSLSTIDAFDMAKKEGATTIALTDNPEGVANGYADHVWLTKSGVETYNISPSAPTTCAMAYLLKIAEMLQGIPRSRIHSDVITLSRDGSDILNWAKKVGPMIADTPTDGKPLYLISSGPNYIAAQLGMMKFNEYSLVKGIAVLREEFQHHTVLSIEKDDRSVLISDSPVNELDDRYLDVMKNKLEMQSYHLYTPGELHLESSLGQAIANTIALQIAAYHHAEKNNPKKERFKMPHAEAFRIY